MPKFKVGDVITVQEKEEGMDRSTGQIVAIVFEEQIFKGNWVSEISERKVSECYILEREDKMISYLKFYEEHQYEIVQVESETSTSCPRCGGELEEKETIISLFSNEMVKINKCKNIKCGWC